MGGKAKSENPIVDPHQVYFGSSFSSRGLAMKFSIPTMSEHLVIICLPDLVFFGDGL